MRGVARATAAVTVVNALPVGIGSAIGIELGVTATVDLAEGPLQESGFRCTPPESATPLVRAAVEAANEQLHSSSLTVAAVEIRSEIPAAKGLKSSSAVAAALCTAALEAAGRPLGPLGAARLAAKVGRASRTSATGALDDALAGLSGGLVVTDNRADRLLSTRALEPDLVAVLWVPPGHHPAAPSLAERFAFEKASAESAVDRALSGAWPGAMELNTELVERALGYDYGGVRAACRGAGAVAAGISGLGPALAAISPTETAHHVASCFPSDRGEVLTVALSRAPRLLPEEAR